MDGPKAVGDQWEKGFRSQPGALVTQHEKRKETPLFPGVMRAPKAPPRAEELMTQNDVQ